MFEKQSFSYFALFLPVRFLKIWLELGKFRLTLLVVFSSLVSYYTLAESRDDFRVLMLALGGFLITSSANTLNQILEQQSDAEMERTRERPLPSGRTTRAVAWMMGLLSGTAGFFFLLQIGPLHAWLGLLSVILYVLVYTPLKKITPWAVFAGAFPGSFPVLMGAMAAIEDRPDKWLYAWLLFFIQFIWQFPHFWSLAWFNFEDYSRASFFLLPTGKEKNPRTAYYILFYSCVLMVISLLPFFFRFSGPLSALCILICGIGLIWQSYLFLRHTNDAMARRLFLISLVYLPVVQLSLMTGV